jgi:N-acetylglucosaminyldiphosphoundecaprenol N-acetyl-beta-D-mannosaminyltransferase
MPLIWASKLQGTPLPERVAGSNLISSLSAAAAERGRGIYLLGGATGTAEAAADVLSQRYPKLRVCGTCCPTIDFEDGADGVAAVTENLRQAKPDIVYVALGSPKQEVLIDRLRDQLPGAWWLGVGNSFSFLCGHVHRAPLGVQRAGFEWLHRLIQEPRRLGRRYLIDGCPFAVKLLVGAAIQRLKSG